LEDLKVGVLEYKMAGEFLADLRKEFGKGEEETVKAVKLRRLEQGRNGRIYTRVQESSKGK